MCVGARLEVQERAAADGLHTIGYYGCGVGAQSQVEESVHPDTTAWRPED